MTGMNVVGDLFGLGKCFASGGQIGSSDEKAVAYLLPLLKRLSKLTNQERKNLMATVKEMCMILVKISIGSTGL
jgi:cobalamin-dependent methionine synthase I